MSLDWRAVKPDWFDNASVAFEEVKATPRKRQLFSLDQLKASLDLREIIELERESSFGTYKLGRCPFPEHEDHNPSFLVYSHSYKCQSCGRWGTIIDWWIHKEHGGVDTPIQQVIDEIVEHYNLDPYRLASTVVTKADTDQDRRKWDWREPKYDLMDPSTLPVPCVGRERDYLKEHYLLTDDVIDHERLGFSAWKKAFVIPVWNSQHNGVFTVRYRRFDDAYCEAGQVDDQGRFWSADGKWLVPRYFGIKDRNDPLLYNRYRLTHKRFDGLCGVRFVFGELTCLYVDRVYGADAVSCTNGVESFRPYFAGMVDKARYSYVYVIPDVGEMKFAEKIASTFITKTWIVPTPQGYEGDVIDWVKAGLTTRELLELENLRIPPTGIICGSDELLRNGNNHA